MLDEQDYTGVPPVIGVKIITQMQQAHRSHLHIICLIKSGVEKSVHS